MTLFADPLTLTVALIAVIILGAAKGGLTGLGTLATPLVAMVLPAGEAAALLLPVLIVQDAISVWSFRHTWDRWIVAWMLPGAVVGIALATAFAALVNEAMLKLLLGTISLVFGLYRLWVERGGRIAAPSNSPGWVGALFGAATGFTSQIAHAGGPPFQIWVTPRKLNHLTFVGTNAILFAAINWLKVPGYILLGSLNRHTFLMALALMPAAIISTLITLKLVRRMHGQRFYTVVYVLMVLLGAKLIFDALH